MHFSARHKIRLRRASSSPGPSNRNKTATVRLVFAFGAVLLNAVSVAFVVWDVLFRRHAADAARVAIDIPAMSASQYVAMFQTRGDENTDRVVAGKLAELGFVNSTRRADERWPAAGPGSREHQYPASGYTSAAAATDTRPGAAAAGRQHRLAGTRRALLHYNEFLALSNFSTTTGFYTAPDVATQPAAVTGPFPRAGKSSCREALLAPLRNATLRAAVGALYDTHLAQADLARFGDCAGSAAQSAGLARTYTAAATLYGLQAGVYVATYCVAEVLAARQRRRRPHTPRWRHAAVYTALVVTLWGPVLAAAAALYAHYARGAADFAEADAARVVVPSTDPTIPALARVAGDGVGARQRNQQLYVAAFFGAAFVLVAALLALPVAWQDDDDDDNNAGEGAARPTRGAVKMDTLVSPPASPPASPRKDKARVEVAPVRSGEGSAWAPPPPVYTQHAPPAYSAPPDPNFI